MKNSKVKSCNGLRKLSAKNCLQDRLKMSSEMDLFCASNYDEKEKNSHSTVSIMMLIIHFASIFASTHRLINKLQPGSVAKIHTTGASFKLMENISSFQNAIKKYGVPDEDCFQTVDLFEKRNIPQVAQSLMALGRTVTIAIILQLLLHIIHFIFSLKVLSTSGIQRTLFRPKTIRRMPPRIYGSSIEKERRSYWTSIWIQQRRYSKWPQFWQYSSYVEN